MSSRLNEYAYESSTIGTQAVTTTSANILAGNPHRRSAIITNVGATDVYLAIGREAEPGKGICLKANGGAYELHALNLTHAAIHAITAAGTSTVSTHEGT